MKKLRSIVMVVVLVLLLGGCGASEKDALVGAWKAELDLTDIFNTSMTRVSAEDMAEYLKVEAFSVAVTLTFREDDTYSMKVDEAALNETMQNIRSDIQAGMERYLVDLVAAEGVEMSLEEILTLSGLSMSDLMDEIITPELTASVVENINAQGKFEAEGGKLYLSAGLQFAVDKNIYEPYRMEGTTLTLLEIVSDEAVDNFTSAMYPMIFQKIS